MTTDVLAPTLNDLTLQALHDAAVGVEGVAFLASPTPLWRIVEGAQPSASGPSRLEVKYRDGAWNVDVSIALTHGHTPVRVAEEVYQAIHWAWKARKELDRNLADLAHVGVHIVCVVTPESADAD